MGGDNWFDYNYLIDHSGNHHIIPQNKKVLDLLTNNITLSSQIILEGCLVNLYGKNGNQYYSWKTDLTIGNYACEIMLVENIIISIDN